MSTKEPLILVVDEQDRPIGAIEKDDMWRRGVLHRCSRIMVEDSAGNVLLQKRSNDKSLYPGRWDNSVAGHVDEGEEYLAAALREAEEEIGLKGLQLQEIGAYRNEASFEWRKINQFNKVYKVVVDRNKAKFTTSPHEVSELKWFTRDEVKRLVAEHPDQTTDGLHDVIEKFY